MENTRTVPTDGAVGDAVGRTRHGNRRLPLQCWNGGRAAPSRRSLLLHDEPVPRVLGREPGRQSELLDLGEALPGMAANLHTHIVTTGTINIKSALQFPALDEFFPQTQATACTHWPRSRMVVLVRTCSSIFFQSRPNLKEISWRPRPPTQPAPPQTYPSLRNSKPMRRGAGRVALGKRGSKVDRRLIAKQEPSRRPPHRRCFRKE
jgi:hypothetical protein